MPWGNERFRKSPAREAEISAQTGWADAALRLHSRLGMMHPETSPSVQNQNDAQHLADPAEDWPTLDVLRLRYIHRAIAHTGNNKTRAAELLGIDRRTLNRILARERARRRATGTAETTTH